MPEEATNPASCGVVEGAGAGKPARNGIETGGDPGIRAQDTSRRGRDRSCPGIGGAGGFRIGRRPTKASGSADDGWMAPKQPGQSLARRTVWPCSASCWCGLGTCGRRPPIQPWRARRASGGSRRCRPAHPSPRPRDPRRERAGRAFATRSPGWCCRSRTRWRCPSPRSALGRAWSSSDSTTTVSMEVPKDPALAGWFVRGASPGALGPAVIAGHVTWDGVLRCSTASAPCGRVIG